jgi:ornithine cyclodeaminase
MGTVRVLVESDLRDAVSLGTEELEAIEAVYPLVSRGEASMPPIMRIDVPAHNGEIDIKSAFLPGYPGIAVKVSAGFFNNPDRGLPSLGGLMLVFDAETGVPQSALFDNGYLTDLRTGLAGGVAAKHLARENATVATVFGAGVQAGYQLEALAMVRPIERVRVWARDHEKASDFATHMSDRLGIEVVAVRDRGEAVSGADILVTATPSTDPLLDASMLREGMHVTSVGSDAETKQELSATVVERCDVFVCDSLPQSSRLGELRAAIAAGVSIDHAVELGQVIDGLAAGRTDGGQITVCDLTGTGAQDTAIASLAVQRCIESGSGTAVET